MLAKERTQKTQWFLYCSIERVSPDEETKISLTTAPHTPLQDVTITFWGRFHLFYFNSVAVGHSPF